MQGVDINDKHIEVIVRQMLRKVKVEDPGDTAHYKNIEESLQNTLLMAQQTSEEIKRNSYQKGGEYYQRS